jgi:hypothetical protein
MVRAVGGHATEHNYIRMHCGRTAQTHTQTHTHTDAQYCKKTTHGRCLQEHTLINLYWYEQPALAFAKQTTAHTGTAVHQPAAQGAQRTLHCGAARHCDPDSPPGLVMGAQP